MLRPNVGGVLYAMSAQPHGVTMYCIICTATGSDVNSLLAVCSVRLAYSAIRIANVSTRLVLKENTVDTKNQHT